MLTWFRKPGDVPVGRQPLEPVIAMRSGAAMLEEFEPVIAEIRRQVGVPAAHWAPLYRAVFEAVAGFVQSLPACEPDLASRATSLLERRLEIVQRALALRRGRLLPAGAPIEEVAERQDAWTYGVATAALLRGVGAAVLALRVELLDARGRSLGDWDPWTGPMRAATVARYRLLPRTGIPTRLPSRLPLLVLHALVPPLGLRWISSDDLLFDSWLAAVCGDELHLSGEIGRLCVAAEAPAFVVPMATAAQAIARPRLFEEPAAPSVIGAPAPPPLVTALAPSALESVESRAVDVPAVAAPPQKPASRPRAPESAPPARTPSNPPSHPPSNPPFLAWLREGLRSGRIPANVPGARVYAVEEGLLLVTPAIFRDFAGIDGGPVEQKTFLKLKLHRKNPQGDNLWSFRIVSEAGTSTRVQGLVLPSPPGLFGSAASSTRLRLQRIDEPVCAPRTVRGMPSGDVALP